MKISKSKLALAVVGLAAVGVAGLGVAGISATKHNLGASNGLGGTPNKNTSTGEICVFCHTPHAADTAAAVPLWNKTLKNPNTYTTYDQLGTSSLDGGVASVGSVSLACLSCHDGSQAMDNMVNAPGSGNTAIGTGGWSGTNQTTGKLTGFAKLGTDLQNDHPVGIQYCGGGVDDSSKTSSGCVDKDFQDANLKNTNLNGLTVWWVNASGGTTSREKTDMQLYTRDTVSAAAGGYAGSFAGEPEPFVECASCHDPHTENTTFLRTLNTGSAVCLACHDK